MEKTCTKCGQIKSTEEFYKARIYKGTQYYTSKCKECTDEYNKPYGKKYKESEKFKRYESWYKKRRICENPDIKERIRLQKIESRKRCLVHNLWKRTKDRAARKNIEFEILESEIKIPDICPLLEIPLFVGDKNGYQNSPSIDRIDNSKGYIKGNWRIISMFANSMKNSASEKQLLTFSKNIPKYLIDNDIVQTIEKSIESKDKEP